MPSLDTDLHLRMLARNREADTRLYGLHWGDPDKDPSLRTIRERYIEPYVDPQKVCVEIGVGGGRWTRYLTGFKTVYAVDFHKEMFVELAKNVDAPNVVYVNNNGTDFPGIAPGSVDFLFTFGTFVHLDLDIIEKYLENMFVILKPGARAFVQYSDKTKEVAKNNKNFSDNEPAIMIPLVESKGFRVLEEERELRRNASGVLMERP